MRASVLLFLFLFTSPVYAQPIHGGSGPIIPGFVQLQTEDGSTVCDGNQINVTNGDLTDNADGTCSIDTAGAGGSGDITEVGDCTSGACSSPTISALDFGTVDLATDALDLSEGNISNIGQVELDTIISDGNDITMTPTNNVLISDGKRFIVGHTTNLQMSNDSPFQILGTSGAKASMGMGRWSNSASGVASYNVLKSRATVIGNHAIVQDNDNVGQFKFLADDNVDFDTQIAKFSAEVDDANPATGIIGGAFVFALGDGTNATPVEAMRIASNGNVTVGSSGTALAKLGIDGNSDEVQLLIQGHSTQATDIFVIETSDGTDVMTANTLGVRINKDFDAASQVQFSNLPNSFLLTTNESGVVSANSVITTSAGDILINPAIDGDEVIIDGIPIKSISAVDVDGVSNIFIGTSSGDANTTGDNNVFIGDLTGQVNTTGGNNVLLGRRAGNANTIGVDNFYLGKDSGFRNVDGNRNVFIGSNTGVQALTDDDNVYIGTNSGVDGAGAISNVCIGSQTCNQNVTGDENVAIGRQALNGVDGNSFSDNTMIGRSAGRLITTGDRNVAVGWKAMEDLTTGDRNIAIGYDVGGGWLDTENDVLAIDITNTTTPLLHGDFSLRTLRINGSHMATPPTVQTITGGTTITADGCGTLKLITAASGVTTNTTDTFSDPTALNDGCVMHVCNTGSNTITLDNNAKFVSEGAADVPVTANDCLTVIASDADGLWYQVSPLLAN